MAARWRHRRHPRRHQRRADAHPVATTTTSHSAPRIEAPDVIPNGAANGSA